MYGYCYNNHGENFRLPGATLTNRAPNDCSFTFVCSKLEGNPCGDYGVEISLGDGHSEQVILVWPCLTFDPIMTLIWDHLTVTCTLHIAGLPREFRPQRDPCQWRIPLGVLLARPPHCRRSSLPFLVYGGRRLAKCSGGCLEPKPRGPPDFWWATHSGMIER